MTMMKIEIVMKKRWDTNALPGIDHHADRKRRSCVNWHVLLMKDGQNWSENWSNRFGDEMKSKKRQFNELTKAKDR